MKNRQTAIRLGSELEAEVEQYMEEVKKETGAELTRAGAVAALVQLGLNQWKKNLLDICEGIELRAFFSTLPDGRKVQRLDTLGLSDEEMIGKVVFHPEVQVGEDRCAWTGKQVDDLDVELSGQIMSEESGSDEPSYDEGVVVDVWFREDSMKAARFITRGLGSLHYPIRNLWVIHE